MLARFFLESSRIVREGRARFGAPQIEANHGERCCRSRGREISVAQRIASRGTHRISLVMVANLLHRNVRFAPGCIEIDARKRELRAREC